MICILSLLVEWVLPRQTRLDHRSEKFKQCCTKTNASFNTDMDADTDWEGDGYGSGYGDGYNYNRWDNRNYNYWRNRSFDGYYGYRPYGYAPRPAVPAPQAATRRATRCVTYGGIRRCYNNNYAITIWRNSSQSISWQMRRIKGDCERPVWSADSTGQCNI